MEYNRREGKKVDQRALADDETIVSISVYLVSLRQHLCYYDLI